MQFKKHTVSLTEVSNLNYDEKVKHYIFIIIISFIYIFLTLTAPISSSSASLGLSPIAIRLLQVTIAIIYILTWMAGVTGYKEIKGYSDSVSDNAKKSAFHKKAVGVLILIGSTILGAFLSAIRNRLPGDYAPFFTIATNYINVFGPLLSLSYMAAGASELSKSIKAPEPPASQYALGVIFCALIIGLDGWSVLSQKMITGYFIPEPLIIMTILIPSFLTWVIGTVAIITSFNYIKNVQGTVYKTGLREFNIGILFAILTSMFLQLLLSVGSQRLLGIGLGAVLLIVYLFLILQAVGFIYIALGSRKLATVENILSKYTKAR